jgi:hypothetical protein
LLMFQQHFVKLRHDYWLNPWTKWWRITFPVSSMLDSTYFFMQFLQEVMTLWKSLAQCNKCLLFLDHAWNQGISYLVQATSQNKSPVCSTGYPTPQS